MEQTREHLNIRVYGQVQGVFFRQSSIDKAKQLGITGFARNEPDGTVYIEAEGSEEALEQFQNWCREGSSSARVDDVSVWGGEVKDYEDFIAH